MQPGCPSWSFSAIPSVTIVLIMLLCLSATGRSQQPQVDVDDPLGFHDVRGKLGRPIGSAGIASDDNSPTSPRPATGRVGASVSRAPVDHLNATGEKRRDVDPANFRMSQTKPAQIPASGELAETGETPETLGPADGMTLDQAIDRLLNANIALLALRYEVPLADADILSASLRANPIFYADAQLVPYGSYNNDRPGGQRQFDVNVTYPIDVTFKRKARITVAERAKFVTQAQFQDAVRQQIDNLYTVYVDELAAQQTLAFSQAYFDGITRLRDRTKELFDAGAAIEADVDSIQAQVERAQLQIRESREAVISASRSLALLLDVPRDQVNGLRVRSFLRDVRPLPDTADHLIELALEHRADVMSQRLGVGRADAEVKLAQANRYPDVYLLYQPYTFQDNSPFGFKSATSWAVGVTAVLPIYNRNQGNIQRARVNAQQTRLELVGIEKQVAYDVEQAIREFNLSLRSVVEIEREILPAIRRVRNTAYQNWQGGETTAMDYLEAQKDYNEEVRHYRDSLVRHRRAMLDLNTSVGVRVLP